MDGGIIEARGRQVSILTTHTHAHASTHIKGVYDDSRHNENTHTHGRTAHTLNYFDILLARASLVGLCLLKVLLQLYFIGAIFY